MESGPPSPERPGEPGSAPPTSPQAPGPQAPPTGPQTPPTIPSAPPAPETPPGYTGPAPPGGWHQPLTQQPQGWVGTPLAGWWSRVGAQILDWLILTIPVIAIVVLVVIVAAGSDVGAVVTAIISTFAYLIAALFYAPLLMKRPGAQNGQTWGKQVIGIRVVRDSGQQVDLGYAMLREVVVKYLLFNVIGGFFFSIPTILNYLWPLWDDENRCLHDMIVSSHVVRA
jgi:uncharacterized RDD family membrane protein YckC